VIIAKSWDVELDMVDGKTVRAPAGYALLHGSPIPSGTALWMPFDRTPVDVPPSKDAVQYIGPDVKVTAGLELPDMELSAWDEIGEVQEAWYRRRGTYAGQWHHPFGEKKRLWVFTRRKPVLYEMWAIRRVELRGASWTWRGLVG
jgi:hypothetical protein